MQNLYKSQPPPPEDPVYIYKRYPKDHPSYLSSPIPTELSNSLLGNHGF